MHVKTSYSLSFSLLSLSLSFSLLSFSLPLSYLIPSLSFFLSSSLSLPLSLSLLYYVGEFVLCHDKAPLVMAKLGVNHNYSTQQLLNRYEYSSDSELYLSRHSVIKDNCVRVEWTGLSTTSNPLIDCYDMGDDNWFGGYESLWQHWPINSDSRERTPFLPRDYSGHMTSSDFGPILHPIWVSSKGVAIYVDNGVPLHVSINDSYHSNHICLQSLPYSLECLPGSKDNTVLRYTVCGFLNISAAAQFFLSDSNGINTTGRVSPSLNLFEDPIWSTIDALGDNWTQNDVVQFANNISTNNFPISYFEISDGYSDYNGDLTFSETRFPNVAEMLSDLKALGIDNIMAAVNPFIKYDSLVFSEAISNDIFYPEHSLIQGDDVVLVKWRNGYGAVINYFNNSTRVWEEDRLNEFVLSNGLASLRFDGGTETYLPHCVYTEHVTSPAQYTQQYIDFISHQSYASTAIVSIGYFSQSYPFLFRLLDKNSSSWGLDNGLHSVLTSTLSLGLAGYPFVFPGSNGGHRSKELYIRWLQLATFLPIMEISYPPWKFDQQTIDHVNYLIHLHKEIYNNYTKPIISEALTLNYPIIRPLWWVEPKNMTFITNNDQFLIGDTLLVAPILSAGSNHIVLIPSGSWKCVSNYCSNSNTGNNVYDGPASHKFDNIGLTDLLYFLSCSNSGDSC